MRKIFVIKGIVAVGLIFISSVVVLILKNTYKTPYFNPSDPPSYRRKFKNDVQTKLVIYEFSDFSCPACAKIHFYLKDVVKYFPYISVYFKHYPLTNIHPYAFKAAVWAECAGIKYSKFWEFAEILFENRQKWSNDPNYEKYFEEYTKRLSLDISIMKECIVSSNAVDLVKKDMIEGDKLGVDSTPTFFINGKKVVGGMELVENLKEVIK